MIDFKRSFAYIATLFLILFVGFYSTVQADDLRSSHGVMHPDGETLLRWQQNYQQAPKAQISKKLLYNAEATSSLSLLSHLDYIPSEYNQGSCGDCWIWAGTGVMAIALDVNNSIHDRLSEQYLNSNIANIPALVSEGLGCCQGGTLQYLAEFYSTTGYKKAVPWSNTNADGGGSCPGSSVSTDPNYPISSIQAVAIETQGIEQSAAIANIKSILNQNKAVFFGFMMPTQDDLYSFYDFWDNQTEDSKWDPDMCGHTYTGQGGGHAVLCVGYNDEDPNNSYWIMVNSWGVTSDRPNGIFHLNMNINYDCHYSYNGYSLGSYEWWDLDITYNIQPKPDFTATPTSGAPPLDVTFTDTSTGPHTSWSWDFGDGSTSTLQNPTHTYTTTGTFTVSLTVSGTSGSTYTKTETNYITVSQPGISSSISSLSTSCAKGSNASSQTFQVWNSGAGTLNYVISTDQSWISCATTCGISTGTSDIKTITVDYTTSSLDSGTHTANITITAPGASNTPLTIPVSLTVIPPAISCSPASLDQSCTEGCNASGQIFSVWNSGAGTLNYTIISSGQSWISCSATGYSTGTTDRKSISVGYTASSLTTGTYSATITISDPLASNSPKTIPVTLTVYSPPLPYIAHNAPAKISASCIQGSSPSSTSFNIWNSGGQTLSYTVSTSQPWLSCSPSKGTSTSSACGGGGHTAITITYSTTGLTAGSYSASITINASGASNTPRTIPVSLTVNAPALPSAVPTISDTPTSFNVTCVKGSNASSQSFDVWNSGTGTLNYSIYDDAAWLSCAPSNGTSTDGHNVITVYFANSGLASGTYPATITISAPGASNSPQTIPVSLTVSDPVIISTAKSTFSIDPTSLTVTCTQGSDAADQSTNIWNSGEGALNYSISTDADWITISPASGALTSDQTMITVHLKTSDLAVGEYDQNITVISADTNVTNSPQTIPVHVSVKAAAVLSTGGGGGGGGGGCFISTSVSNDDVPQGLYFFVFAGIMFAGMARLIQILRLRRVKT